MTELEVGVSCQSETDLDSLADRFHKRLSGVLAKRGATIVATVVAEGVSSAVELAIDVCLDLEAIGLQPCRVDRDLVDASEAASRLGVSRQAINLWANGSRRQGQFPDPIGFPGGKRIWAWTQIASWWRSRNSDAAEPQHLTLEEMSVLDCWIANRKTSRGWTSTNVVPLRDAGHKPGVLGANQYVERQMCVGG